jgi:hypothetical protein
MIASCELSRDQHLHFDVTNPFGAPIAGQNYTRLNTRHTSQLTTDQPS